MRMWAAMAAAVLLGCSGGGEEECETTTWFMDADEDGYGLQEVTGCVADRPASAVNIAGDCNDDDPDINAGAQEVCNGVDDDCDDRVDDDDTDVSLEGLPVYYIDADADGYGDEGMEVVACERPTGVADVAGDCNDGDETINPEAEETCYDTVDVDCDGVRPDDDADNDLVLACEDCDDGDDTVGGPTLWYRDADGDTFGDTEMALVQCDQPTGSVANGDDCDDTSIAINPNATERCDGFDNDCDGSIDDEDDNVMFRPTWYTDGDADGYGDPNDGQALCDPPDNMVSNNLDCDDTTEEIGPPSPWYADSDGDGYGDQNGAASNACNQPFGRVADNTDCDDTDELINPDTEWFEDSDEDDYGDPGSSRAQCTQPTGTWVLDDTDCDDSTHVVHPGRFDFGDGEDNDCDDETDEDVGSEQYDSSDIQTIVDARCGNACHVNGSSSGGLNLDNVWDDTVGVSAGGASMDYITPGDLRESYLWHKLQGTQGSAGGGGGNMPAAGSLSSTEENTIEDWILEGAIE